MFIRENLASMGLVLPVLQADSSRELGTCAPLFTSSPITYCMEALYGNL